VHYYSQSILLADQMYLIIQNLEVKIYVVYKSLKYIKLKITQCVSDRMQSIVREYRAVLH